MRIKNNRTIKTNIILILMVLVFNIICFAQTTESDLLVDDASFNYYKIIEQRNFFRPKKGLKKIAAETELEEKDKTQKKEGLDFILTGVIEIKNGYKAIVEQKSSKKGFYVSVNEAIEDYTVKAIQLNKIIIEKNGKEFELKLQQGSPKDVQETTPETKNSNKVQQIDISEAAPFQPTLRANTMQQIRSGARGTK